MPQLGENRPLNDMRCTLATSDEQFSYSTSRMPSIRDVLTLDRVPEGRETVSLLPAALPSRAAAAGKEEPSSSMCGSPPDADRRRDFARRVRGGSSLISSDRRKAGSANSISLTKSVIKKMSPCVLQCSDTLTPPRARDHAHTRLSSASSCR